MAVQIRLTERQQKLAAGELDRSELDEAGSLRDAGFDFIEGDEGDDSGTSGSQVSSRSGNDLDGTGIEPSGEYIDDDESSDGTGKQSGSRRDASLPFWVDDAALEYASSYGITEDDLADFGSFEQLQRVGTVIDRKLTSGVDFSKKGDASGEQISVPGAGKGVQSESTDGGDGQSRDTGPLGRLKPLDRKKYEEARYGEAELDLVDQLNATIEAVREIMPAFQQQTERQKLEQQQAEDAEFHKALDDLDPEVYGQVVDNGKVKDQINPAFQETRAAVREAMGVLRQAIIRDAEQRGVAPEIPSTRALAMRAARVLEYQSGQHQQTSQVNAGRVAEQSRRRRPVGSGGVRRGTVGTSGSGKSGGSGPGNGSVDDVKKILNNPEIASFWKQTQRENGVT